MQDLQFLADMVRWEVNVCFLVSVLFPVVTWFFWPWHESSWGWNIVLLEIGIAGTLFPSWMHIDFQVTDLPLEWMQVIFLALVPANVIWRTVIIWRVQRAGAREPSPPGTPGKRLGIFPGRLRWPGAPRP
jgi:hypothetical protein